LEEAPQIAGPLHLGVGMLDWKVWAKGVAAALIGGGASAVAAAITAPGIANGSRESWMVLLRMSAVAAVLNAAAYLKKSPLPMAENDNRGE
jgi:hypothetical protein